MDKMFKSSVIAFRRFGTPILPFESSFSEFDSAKCQFVSAFYGVDSSFPEFDSYCLFDSSADLFDSSFCEVRRFVVLLWRFSLGVFQAKKQIFRPTRCCLGLHVKKEVELIYTSISIFGIFFTGHKKFE